MTRAAAGAASAGHVLVRLPYEIKALMAAWLEAHRPLRASHGFDSRQVPQRADLFRPPRLDGQMELFGA